MGAEEGTLRSAYDLTDMAEGEHVDEFTAKQLGNLGELIAASYLDQRGYEVLEQGYRCPEGEADLIAYDPTKMSSYWWRLKHDACTNPALPNLRPPAYEGSERGIDASRPAISWIDFPFFRPCGSTRSIWHIGDIRDRSHNRTLL